MRERLKYTPVRMDNVATHYYYDFKCGTPGCGRKFTFHSQTVLPDDIVMQKASAKMSKRGWVIGKKQDSNMCPKCVGIQEKNRLASTFKVLEGGKQVESAAELAHHVVERLTDTDKLLEKHFGPKKEKKPSPSTQLAEVHNHHHTTNIDLSPLVAELQANRVAMELMFDQQSRTNELLAQTINAVAQIPPHILRGHETVSQRLVELREAIVTPMVRPITEIEQAVAQEPKLLAPPNHEPVADLFSEASVPMPENVVFYRAPRKQSVYSNPVHVRSTLPKSLTHFNDKKMWLTTIAINNKVLEDAGFSREDEFYITRHNKTLSVSKATGKFGIKPRTSSKDGISISSYKLGDCSEFTRFRYIIQDGKLKISMN